MALKCSECKTLTIDTCPECKDVALCAACITEYSMCANCGEPDEDSDEDSDDDDDEQDDEQGDDAA